MFSGFKWQSLSLLGNTRQYLLLFINFFLSNSSGYFLMSEHAQYSCPLWSLFPMWLNFCERQRKDWRRDTSFCHQCPFQALLTFCPKLQLGTLLNFNLWPGVDPRGILMKFCRIQLPAGRSLMLSSPGTTWTTLSLKCFSADRQGYRIKVR